MRSRGHLYEELPIQSIEDEAFEPSTIDMTAQTPNGGMPSLNLTQANQSFTSNEHLLHNNSHLEFNHTFPRKRNNPLYDSKDDEDEAVIPAGGSTVCSGFCLCASLLFVLFVCVSALCVSVYVLLNYDSESEDPKSAYVIQPSTNINSSVLARIEQLERHINDLESELQGYQHAQSAAASEQSEALTSLSEQLESLTMRTDQLQQNVSAVRKMQGPQGVGNLSACEYKKLSGGINSAAPSNDSPRSPDDLPTHEAWVMLGVECSTTGGTLSLLNSEQTADGFEQYWCTCSGSLGGTGVARHCLLHVWRCPRLS